MSNPVATGFSDPDYTLIDPSVSVRGDTTYVAANVWPRSENRGIPMPGAVLLRVPGQPLPLPDSARRYVLPQGVVDTEGIYHLVWAEASTPTTSPIRWPGNLGSLWHAQFDGAWSVPERILSAHNLRWGFAASRLVADRSGGVHAVVPVVRTPAEQPLVYLRRDRGTWRSTALGNTTTYATLTTAGSDSILIAFSGAGSGITRGNVLYTTRSVDGGETWAPPAMLDRPNRGMGVLFPVLEPQRETVVLGWVSATSDTTQFVRLAHTADFGQSWTRLQDSVPAAQTILGVASASHPRLGVVVAIESFEQGTPQIELLRFQLGRLSSQRPFRAFALSSAIGLAPTHTGFTMVWRGARESEAPALSLTSTVACDD